MADSECERLRRHVELACILEASAPKPGNVYATRDFQNLTYLNLIHSGVAVGPILASIQPETFGQTVFEAVRVSRSVVRTNANLGILLLLAPLCCAAKTGVLNAVSVDRVIDSLTVEDARWVYQAIRLAEPGGLGKVNEQDVNAEVTVTLKQAMALAADRDTIALQYTNGLADVFDTGVTALAQSLNSGASLAEAIVWCQLCWLARFADTLIARKRGREEAVEAAKFASRILEQNQQGLGRGLLDQPELGAFDSWLTAVGNQRNPGTTADLVAATLFCALEQSLIA